MFRANLICGIVASTVALTAYSSAKAQAVITGTTYEYTAGAPTAAGNNFTFATDAQAVNEVGLINGNFGTGTYNTGGVPDQAYFNTHPIREDGYTGSWPAYQGGGQIGQSSFGMPANTAAQDFTQGVYFSGPVSISYNLGATYNNLSMVNVYWVLDGTGFPPGALTISDGTDPAVVGTFTDHGDTPTTPNARGNYLEDSFDISSLHGSNLTLSFAGPQGAGSVFQAFEQINFTTSAVPEPASLSMLGVGGLVLLRRRSRRA